MSGEISVRRIGEVHTSASVDEIREGREGVEYEIEIYPEYEDALTGIDGFSHILVLSFFDNLRDDQLGVLKVRPRRLMKYGIPLEQLPLVGVFALDSPSRPNPIGLSLAPLRGRDGRKLKVTNLDFFDRTPVLDIKPYQSGYRVDSYSVPEWHSSLHDRLSSL